MIEQRLRKEASGIRIYKMWEPEKDAKMQHAIKAYLLENKLVLPDNATYEAVIDLVFVCVDDHPVLRIGLPPVTNYAIHETEYTDRYMRVNADIKKPDDAEDNKK